MTPYQEDVSGVCPIEQLEDDGWYRSQQGQNSRLYVILTNILFQVIDSTNAFRHSYVLVRSFLQRVAVHV